MTLEEYKNIKLGDIVYRDLDTLNQEILGGKDYKISFVSPGGNFKGVIDEMVKLGIFRPIFGIFHLSRKISR